MKITPPDGTTTLTLIPVEAASTASVEVPESPDPASDAFSPPRNRITLLTLVQGGKGEEKARLRREQVQSKDMAQLLANCPALLKRKQYEQVQKEWITFRAKTLEPFPVHLWDMLDITMPLETVEQRSALNLLEDAEARLQRLINRQARTGLRQPQELEILWNHVSTWPWLKPILATRLAIHFADPSLQHDYVDARKLTHLRKFIEVHWDHDYPRMIRQGRSHLSSLEAYQLIKTGFLPAPEVQNLLAEISIESLYVENLTPEQLRRVGRVLDYYQRLSPGIWEAFEQFPHLSLLIWQHRGHWRNIVNFFAADSYLNGSYAKLSADLKIFAEACVRSKQPEALEQVWQCFDKAYEGGYPIAVQLAFGEAWLKLGNPQRALTIADHLTASNVVLPFGNGEQELAVKSLATRAVQRIGRKQPSVQVAAEDLTPVTDLETRRPKPIEKPTLKTRLAGLILNPHVTALSHHAATHAPLLSAAALHAIPHIAWHPTILGAMRLRG